MAIQIFQLSTILKKHSVSKAKLNCIYNTDDSP